MKEKNEKDLNKLTKYTNSIVFWIYLIEGVMIYAIFENKIIYDNLP